MGLPIQNDGNQQRCNQFLNQPPVGWVVCHDVRSVCWWFPCPNSRRIAGVFRPKMCILLRISDQGAGTYQPDVYSHPVMLLAQWLPTLKHDCRALPSLLALIHQYQSWLVIIDRINQPHLTIMNHTSTSIIEARMSPHQPLLIPENPNWGWLILHPSTNHRHQPLST